MRQITSFRVFSLSLPITVHIYLTLYTFRIRFTNCSRDILTSINPQCNQLTSALLALPHQLSIHQKPFEAKTQEDKAICSSDYLLLCLLRTMLILMKIFISCPSFDGSQSLSATPEAEDRHVVISVTDSSFLRPQVSSAS